MPQTNYTVKGYGLTLKDQWGTVVGSQDFALVQWELGYNPLHHPLSEWTGNPTMVQWVGTYDATGKTWGTTAAPINFDAPLFIFTQLTENYSQAGLWQISDVLALPGGEFTFNINQANIRDVMGSHSAGVLYTADFGTWTPQAVPEPSYAWPAAVLFVGALFARLRGRSKRTRPSVP